MIEFTLVRSPQGAELVARWGEKPLRDAVFAAVAALLEAPGHVSFALPLLEHARLKVTEGTRLADAGRVGEPSKGRHVKFVVPLESDARFEED